MKREIPKELDVELLKECCEELGIELIEKTCNDCIFYPMCFVVREVGAKDRYAGECKRFKDKSDYVEVKHGEWIQISYTTLYKCSVCTDMTDMPYQNKLFDYCPNCGAKMDGGNIK